MNDPDRSSPDTARKLSLRADAAVDRALALVREAAERASLDALRTCGLAAAVAEIATNAVRHGRSGQISVRLADGGRGVEVVVADRGPGIEDVEAAIQDGFSSVANSLGLGLGAARRSVDFFRLESNPGQGTVVHLRSYRPLAAEHFDLSYLSLADSLEVENGDVLVYREIQGERLRVAIIDGLGQGHNARRAAEITASKVLEDNGDDLDVLVARAHLTLRKQHPDSGAALGLAEFSRHAVRYVGVGDTSLRLLGAHGEEFSRLSGRPGIIGSNLAYRASIEVKQTPADGYFALMYSDGIRDPYFESALSPSVAPGAVAEAIMERCRRPHGDATIAVLRVRP